ncbi:MAG TPA: metallophosphoesterase [Chitinophagaceae bacterium]|nr:metallophosphoesterase [Chitinophagaceae bacterium]
MRNSPFWWILIGFMLLLDLYVFQAVKVLTQAAGPKVKLIIHISYWAISALAIITLVILPYLHFTQQHKLVRNTFFAIIVGLFFSKIIASVFFLVDDLRRAIQWVAGKLIFSGTEGETMEQGVRISRSAFLSWTGMVVGGGLFSSLLYGFNNKYRYQLHRERFAFDNLPAGFKGLKLVQISDIHSGSFTDKHAVKRGVEKILREEPDLILFTGDLINNLADEMNDYMDVFKQVKAPMGVFSILGNHDYGDYVAWPDRNEEHHRREREAGRHLLTPLQQANLDRLKTVHAELGWKLLLDEHVALEKGGDKMALIGVQNWSSKARFPKYGDLNKAYEGSVGYPFKILMSHDPSHWDAQVKPLFPDIDLMLAGHTHGMQFGVEIPGFRWSPVQYVYKEWAGLYQEGRQKLYVNRGYGFIGYPGRVGILPEITVIELV